MDQQSTIAAFILLCLVFLALAFFLRPRQTHDQKWISDFVSAILGGLIAAFLSGTVVSSVNIAAPYLQVTLSATGGIAIFLLILFFRRRLGAGKLDAKTTPQPQRIWARVSDESYGRYYQSSVEGHPDLLVVFIHGITGDSVRSWGEVPNRLREATWKPGDPGRTVEFDVLSIGYPASVLNYATIEKGAFEFLKPTLERGNFRDYTHLVFVVHSTGGLIVKLALFTEMKKWLKDMDAISHIDIIRGELYKKFKCSLLRSSREIINIAVPHSGGSPITWLAVLAYPPLFVLVFVWVGLLRRVPLIGWLFPLREGYSYGYNWITWQLRPASQDLVDLETNYRALVRRFDELRFPRPLSGRGRRKRRRDCRPKGAIALRPD